MAELIPQTPNEISIGKSRVRSSRLSARAIWVLLIPSILVAGVVLLPIPYLIIRATGSDASIWKLIFSTSTLETLTRTLGLAFAVTFASILIAVPVGWLTTRTNLPLRKLWRVLTPLPLVIPSYVGAYLLVSSLGPRGIVAQWLQTWTNIERLPEIYGFTGAFYILTILSYPFVLLSVQAGFQKMDPALEEASRGMGKSAWQTFFKITLPQLRPAITTGSLLVVLYVLRDFGAVSIMRFNTFTRVIYIQYQSLFDRSTAAAFALVLVMITIAILYIEIASRSRTGHYSSTSKSNRPPKIMDLGKWKWPSFIFCLILVSAGVLMPALNLFYWLWRGIQSGEQIGSLWVATQNSIIGAGLAALAVIAVGLPVAILDTRHNTKTSRAIERITYIGFALPGIVIALALVFFGSRYAQFLYQSLPMLVIAYVILFVPEGVGAMRTSLLQVHSNMEEAGRSLGHSPITVFRKITLPLIQPGLIAGAGLVFLTALKELPATLILAPLGFKTLAISVWDAVSEAFFARAAGPALLLILVSSVPLAYLTLRGDKN